MSRVIECPHDVTPAAPWRTGLGAAQPYLVHEYIDGLPIDQHSERRSPDLAARTRRGDGSR
jgi:hypothetical protein